MKRYALIASLIAITVFAISRFYDFASIPEAEPDTAGNSSRLSALLGGDAVEGYATASGARTFHFPEDHGPHPGFRNEWWYLTGNLDGAQGQRFGFELTFFRFSLSPGPPINSDLQTGSGWQTNQVYIAHFAVTDEKSERFHVEQRYSRGALGLAGAQTRPFHVWIEDWSIKQHKYEDARENESVNWELTASGKDLALHLSLTAQKPPALNGADGLSQKSAVQGNASYYYSISRLHSEGSLRMAGQTHQVSGLSWLDREWSSSALAADQQGWDWFALQLSDGSDLMFYNIRKSDGSQDENSAGTWIANNGEVRHLSRDELKILITGEWQSPEGGTYPSGWEIRVPGLDLTLTVRPLIDDQELSTTVRYWEGAVIVTGQRGQQPIEGRGYVELTGYARQR